MHYMYVYKMMCKCQRLCCANPIRFQLLVTCLPIIVRVIKVSLIHGMYAILQSDLLDCGTRTSQLITKTRRFIIIATQCFQYQLP